MIIVAGGADDPNVLAVAKRLESSGVPHVPLLVGEGSNPSFYWDYEADCLYINRQQLRPTALFIRYDVFSTLKDPDPEKGYRAQIWYTSLMGWALSHPAVHLLNRESAQWMTNKPQILHVAREVGFIVPRAIVSNDLLLIRNAVSDQPAIVKPVVDGGYCEDYMEVLEKAPVKDEVTSGPAFVQACLKSPEVRIYAIAGEFYAFRILSDVLDYRTTNKVEINSIEAPQDLCKKLTLLMDRLAMNFGAADFKTCPETGELLFLEINSSPMFSAFDKIAGGAVVDSLVSFLTK